MAVKGKVLGKGKVKDLLEFQNQLKGGGKIVKRFSLIILVGLFLVCGFTSSQAGQVVFEWDPNSEEDLAGYRMYQTTTPGVYTFGVEHAIGDIPAGTETFTLHIEEDGTFYWVATAYDTAGNESGPSNEVSTDINFKPPSPPAGCVLRIPGR